MIKRNSFGVVSVSISLGSKGGMFVYVIGFFFYGLESVKIGQSPGNLGMF